MPSRVEAGAAFGARAADGGATKTFLDEALAAARDELGDLRDGEVAGSSKPAPAEPEPEPEAEAPPKLCTGEDKEEVRSSSDEVTAFSHFAVSSAAPAPMSSSGVLRTRFARL